MDYSVRRGPDLRNRVTLQVSDFAKLLATHDVLALIQERIEDSTLWGSGPGAVLDVPLVLGSFKVTRNHSHGLHHIADTPHM